MELPEEYMWVSGVLAQDPTLRVDFTHPTGNYSLPALKVADHLLKARDNALRRKVYQKKALFRMYWEDNDDDAVIDSDKMKRLFEDKFGFVVGPEFKIPLAWPLADTKLAIGSFIQVNRQPEGQIPNTLLVFHYVGHGTLVDERYLELYPFDGSKKRMSFGLIKKEMIDCTADVLIILDCCHAGAGFRGGAGDQRVELVAASGANEYTHSGPKSFTNFFDMAARELSEKGPFTMQELVCRILEAPCALEDTSPGSDNSISCPSVSRDSIVNILKEPYLTTPIAYPLVFGTGPIKLEPIPVSSPTTSTSSSASLASPRDKYVAIVMHITDDPSDESFQTLIKVINTLSTSSGLTAKLITPLKSSSTILLVALPFSIYECLESSPAYLYVGIISLDDPSVSQSPLDNSHADIFAPLDLNAEEDPGFNLEEPPPSYSNLFSSTSNFPFKSDCS